MATIQAPNLERSAIDGYSLWRRNIDGDPWIGAAVALTSAFHAHMKHLTLNGLHERKRRGEQA